MKNKIKHWLWGISISIVVGFAGLNVLAYNHARAMTHFTSINSRTTKPEELSLLSKVKVLLVGVNIPRPSGQRNISELGSGCQTLTINEPKDITIETWYCDRGASVPLTILFHGYASEKTSMLEEAKTFLELGTSVLLVDFRGSGGSSESYTTIGVREADDVAAVFRYAQMHLPHNKIILYGKSMGAASILRAVHENGVSPDAVILEAVFDTMLNTVRNRFNLMGIPSFPGAEFLVFWGGQQWGFDGFKHNPVDYASSLRCPALFMHGTSDSRATLAEGRRVYDAAIGSKKFIMFDKVGHSSYISAQPDKWRTSIKDFLIPIEKNTNSM